MCRFLNYWSSELKLFFGGPVPFLHFYTSLNPWQERGRNAFNHPLYCTTSFLTVRPGQARCFLFYLFRQSFCCLHGQLLPKLSTRHENSMCAPTVDQKVLSSSKCSTKSRFFSVGTRVGTRLVQPVTKGIMKKKVWNREERRSIEIYSCCTKETRALAHTLRRNVGLTRKVAVCIFEIYYITSHKKLWGYGCYDMLCNLHYNQLLNSNRGNLVVQTTDA